MPTQPQAIDRPTAPLYCGHYRRTFNDHQGAYRTLALYALSVLTGGQKGAFSKC